MSGFDKEMQKTLEADGEKLRQLTGEDHGPAFIGMDFGFSDMGALHCPKCGSPSTWSAPDTVPESCWDCGVKFTYPR